MRHYYCLSMTEREKDLYFKDIFKRNYQKLFLYALYMTSNEEDARDIVGEVFRKVLENYQNVELDYADFYLFISTKSQSIDFIRHRKRNTDMMKHYIEDTDVNEYNLDSYNQRLDDILEVIHTMPEKTQHIMKLCYLEDMTYKEVGEVTGLAPSGVKKHILKGLRTIREKFNVNYKKGQAPKDDA